jgi:hypothetical protein
MEFKTFRNIENSFSQIRLYALYFSTVWVYRVMLFGNLTDSLNSTSEGLCIRQRKITNVGSCSDASIIARRGS